MINILGYDIPQHNILYRPKICSKTKLKEPLVFAFQSYKYFCIFYFANLSVNKTTTQKTLKSLFNQALNKHDTCIIKGYV